MSGASWAEESWAVKRGGETPHSVPPSGDNWSRILQQLCQDERSLFHFITFDMVTMINRKGGIPVKSVGEEQCCWVWPVSIQAAMSENRLNSQTGYPKTWLRNDESDTHLASNQYLLTWHSQNWWPFSSLAITCLWMSNCWLNHASKTVGIIWIHSYVCQINELLSSQMLFVATLN